jgi:GTP-binding protein
MMQKTETAQIERVVAIVGRPNVGKSALFNRLAGSRIAIVHDQEGVTRDRITAECRLGEAPFTIIDTGGIGSVVDEAFAQQVRREADIAIQTAGVILFVVDAMAGIHPVDRDLAAVLRKSGKPVLVVANKIDHEGRSAQAAEFAELGFEEVAEVSAAHGRGITELVESINSRLGPAVALESATSTRPFRVALVGRPNVGKSSLINAILSDDRTIVSDVAGTTRDAVDIPYRRGSRHYTLVDTAGLRPRGRHKTSVEVFSVMRSEKSIERADLCVLVLDGPDGATSQDKKIAGLIQKAEKPCIIAVNKWDLLEPRRGRAEVLHEIFKDLRRELFFLEYAPIVVVSAKEKRHMARLFNTIESVRKACQTRIPTGPFNRLLTEAMTEHPPPMRQNKRLKVLYGTQVFSRSDDEEALGAIRIVLFVNQPILLPDDYRRFLESRIRAAWPCEGVPLRIDLRGREPRGKGRRSH